MCLISIIIPTYNRASIIKDTLDSILNLNYSNWECLIVDDGSTDNTHNIIEIYIEKDKRFKYYERPSDRTKGPNSCRNFGFEKSKGSWVKWFDSDDLFMRNALDFFLNDSIDNVDVIVCKLQRVNFSTNQTINENNIISDNLIQDYLTGEVTFYVCGPTWSRFFLEKQEELFDENIMNLDDWDFNLRMLYQDPKIIYINEALIKYRRHESSLSHEINKLNFGELKSEFLARKKHLELIKENKKANVFIIKTFIKNRYKQILRSALVADHRQKKYFFKKLLISQLAIFDIKGIGKTLLGFTMFSIMNKGYKYYK